MEQFTINGDFPSIFVCLPEGKRSHNYGRSPFLVGKSTISMAIFNSYVTNYQRSYHFPGFFCPLVLLHPTFISCPILPGYMPRNPHPKYISQVPIPPGLGRMWKSPGVAKGLSHGICDDQSGPRGPRYDSKPLIIDPMHQLIGGKHPIILDVSTILVVVQDLWTIHNLSVLTQWYGGVILICFGQYSQFHILGPHSIILILSQSCFFHSQYHQPWFLPSNIEVSGDLFH